MQVYLLDINSEMTDAWEKYFKHTGAKIVNQDFKTFMTEHPNMEAIVSPANSFGLMDGGYDKAIIEYFGKELMEDVQKEIIKTWCGEQPVGTSMSVAIKNKYFIKHIDEEKTLMLHSLLIHTPTMRTPEVINDSRIIYQCMRTTLIEAINQRVDSIVIPAFGGCTGKVKPDTIAKMMYLAYEQICTYPNKLTWDYAYKVTQALTVL